MYKLDNNTSLTWENLSTLPYKIFCDLESSFEKPPMNKLTITNINGRVCVHFFIQHGGYVDDVEREICQHTLSKLLYWLSDQDMSNNQNNK